MPWNVLKILCLNNLTTVGTEQFLEHTRLMTTRAREVMRKQNPVCKQSGTVLEAIEQMTASRLGAVSIVADDNKLVGIFTDGDIRRNLREHGDSFVKMKMSEFSYKEPVTVTADTLLHEVVNIFGSHEFDNIIVTENNTPVGMIDVQDLVRMKLLG
jgi:CBS domain-containing protein